MERKRKRHILLSEFIIRVEFAGCFGHFRAFSLSEGFVNDRKKIKALFSPKIEAGKSSLFLLIKKLINYDKSCSINDKQNKAHSELLLVWVFHPWEENPNVGTAEREPRCEAFPGKTFPVFALTFSSWIPRKRRMKSKLKEL